MTPVDELTRDREQRLLNQSAFPRSFVSCSCERGCLVCAHTGLVSRAEAKQFGHRDPAPTASASRDLRERMAARNSLLERRDLGVIPHCGRPEVRVRRRPARRV